MASKGKRESATTNPRGFDADLEGVTGAAALEPAEAEPLLRRFLTHRSNLIVSRAAEAAARLELTGLTDALATAFHRFLPPAGDPIKTDPQCWAKNDIARTLAGFGYQGHELFLLGLRHIQLEPVWAGPVRTGPHPGQADTAGTLRGTCALALVQCRELPSNDVLRHLTPLFTDEELPVRVNAARAIEQIGTDAAALLLRLRAELGSDTEELISTCIGGVLRLEGTRAHPWAATFLKIEDHLAAETAFLFAEHRSPEAVAVLIAAFTQARDRTFRGTLLTALAANRLPEAYCFLLDLVRQRSAFEDTARKLLLDAQPPEEITTALLAL